MKPDKISALDLLAHVESEIGEMEDLFVVGIDKHGDPAVWATGDLAGLALAALLLQNLAQKQLNGKLDEH